MVRSKHNLWDLVASIEEETLGETGCVDGSCDETESSVEVTDAIESESNAMELAEDVADAEEGAEVIEETISVAEDIEEQVEANETIIEENPAAVTDEVVAASQEMFFVSLARINFTPKKLKSLRVGLEDNAPPLTKLRVSTEGVKDILKALWEKVKAMFQHAWVMLKNLFVKALFWFQNLEKKVDKLIAEVKTFKDEYKCFDASIVAKAIATLNQALAYGIPDHNGALEEGALYDITRSSFAILDGGMKFLHKISDIPLIGVVENNQLVSNTALILKVAAQGRDDITKALNTSLFNKAKFEKQVYERIEGVTEGNSVIIPFFSVPEKIAYVFANKNEYLYVYRVNVTAEITESPADIASRYKGENASINPTKFISALNLIKHGVQKFYRIQDEYSKARDKLWAKSSASIAGAMGLEMIKCSGEEMRHHASSFNKLANQLPLTLLQSYIKITSTLIRAYSTIVTGCKTGKPIVHEFKVNK